MLSICERWHLPQKISKDYICWWLVKLRILKLSRQLLQTVNIRGGKFLKKVWHFKCKPFSRIIRGIVGWVWFTYKEIEPHCDSAIVGNMVTWKPESELFIKGLPFLRNCEATSAGGITLNPVYSPSSIYCIITRHSSVIFFRQPIIKRNACNLYLCLLSYFWKWKKCTLVCIAKTVH